MRLVLVQVLFAIRTVKIYTWLFHSCSAIRKPAVCLHSLTHICRSWDALSHIAETCRSCGAPSNEVMMDPANIRLHKDNPRVAKVVEKLASWLDIRDPQGIAEVSYVSLAERAD